MNRALADYLLAEWARWQAGPDAPNGWNSSTSFGRQIVPDPAPSREPVDVDRAFRTDRVIARLPQRQRFLVKLHYLDPAPVDTKARRLRRGRESYMALIRGVQGVVAMKLGSSARY